MKPELFRPGTCDANVYHDVHIRDEYKLNDLDLNGKVVLDIGGHIGSFAYACVIRGAKKVVSFEPDPDNYCLFRQHLSQEIQDGRVEVYPMAVVEDGSDFPFTNFSGHTSKDGEVNTGGGFIHGLGIEFEVKKEYQTGFQIGVPTIQISSAIESLFVADPYMAKLDCEGAEWEILGVCGKRISFLCGEYHCYREYTPAHLETLLHPKQVTLQPHGDSPLGLFWAK